MIGAGGSRLLARLRDDPEDLVDLIGREVIVGLTGRDDQVGRELDLAQEIRVLEGHVELVVHLITPHAHTGDPLLLPSVPEDQAPQTRPTKI